MAVVVLAYFWFIGHYSINTIWVDQWSDIPLIQTAYSGHLTLASLWAQHGENRVLVQNLIAILLAYSTHYNVVVEEYISGVMAVMATGLLVLAHHRRSPTTPWFFYVPVVLVMLSLVQEGNILFGYAIGWYLVLFALAGSLYLLDRPKLTWITMAGGITVAVIGSYSNLYGLLIWPALLVLLLLRHRRRAVVLTWLACAVVVYAVYFIGFNYQEARPNSGYVFSHPFATINFFLTALGDGLGIQLGGAYYTDVVAFGLLILAIACWVLVTYGRRIDESSGSPIGIVLICFGLPFCVLMTLGRSWIGIGLAGWSRYTTYDLLVVVGCYLAVLDRPARRAHSGPRQTTRAESLGAESLGSVELQWVLQHVRLGVIVILVVAIGVQVLFGTANGISQARSWYDSQVLAADVTANIDKAPDYLINGVLCEACVSLPRQYTPFVRAHHLSLFSTSAGEQYSKDGWKAVPASADPMETYVLAPIWGETMRGSEALVAVSQFPNGQPGGPVIEFEIRGRMLHAPLVLRAGPTLYGDLTLWNTESVPNGRYTVQSVAHSVLGTIVSPPIAISVAN